MLELNQAGESPEDNSERTIVTETGSLPNFFAVLPDGWRHDDKQGIESNVGIFTNGEIELTYEYGGFVTVRNHEKNPDFSVREDMVHGQRVLFVKKDKPDTTDKMLAVYFPESGDRPPLNIYTTGTFTVSQQNTVMDIYKSVRFE